MSLPTSAINSENDIVVLSSPKAILTGKINVLSKDCIVLTVENQKYQFPTKDIQSIFFRRKQNTKTTTPLKHKNRQRKTKKPNILNLLWGLFALIVLILMAVG